MTLKLPINAPTSMNKISSAIGSTIRIYLGNLINELYGKKIYYCSNFYK